MRCTKAARHRDPRRSQPRGARAPPHRSPVAPTHVRVLRRTLRVCAATAALLGSPLGNARRQLRRRTTDNDYGQRTTDHGLRTKDGVSPSVLGGPSSSLVRGLLSFIRSAWSV